MVVNDVFMVVNDVFMVVNDVFIVVNDNCSNGLNEKLLQIK